MNIVVFGASGRTGLPLVEQALAAGHHVTAFVRDPAKLNLRHERLRVVQGHVNDAASVEEAVQGQDAVLSVLGPTRTSPKRTMTSAATNIVRAMKKHGIRRLVSTTGVGVPGPNDEPKLGNRVTRRFTRCRDGWRGRGRGEGAKPPRMPLYLPLLALPQLEPASSVERRDAR